MAAFHLVYFAPAAAELSATRLLLPPLLRKPDVLSLTSKWQRSNLQLLIARAQVETQSINQSEAAEENVLEEDEVSSTRLLVQNVPWTCTVDELRPLFENYGTVTDIEFSMFNKTRNRGLAFVTMGTHEEALEAMNKLESSEFEGRTLRLNWAKTKKTKSLSRPKPQPVHNLFVSNLVFQARYRDLKEFFNADNANVVPAEVIYQTKTRRPAGYGFVSFNTKAEADAALAAFDGKEFMGRPIRVARSKRFLREETKAAIQLENAEQLETAEV